MRKTNKKTYDLIFERYYPLITGTKKANIKYVNKETSIPYEEIVRLIDYEATLKQGTVIVEIDYMDQGKRVKNIIEELKVNCVIIQKKS